MNLYHFSERDDITTFVPRAPLRHPETEPLVFAIDGWHSGLYLFPRDCPRIGVWPVPATTPEHCELFIEWTSSRMLLFIDETSEDSWRTGQVVRYSFLPDGFEDCENHGCWVSRSPQEWVSRETLTDLPASCAHSDVDVRVVPSLVETAQGLFDFAAGHFTTTLHVSMVRCSLLPGWPGSGGSPVRSATSL